MDLPHDPFGSMKRMMMQYSAAERALQQAQAMDPLFQIRKSIGARAFEELYGQRSATQQAYEKSLKEIAEVQRLAKQLDIYEEAQRLHEQANPLKLMATERHYIEAVRKAVAPFDPISDLVQAAQSISALQKYRPFHSERSLDIMTRALAQSNVLDRATDEWGSVQTILRTIQHLQVERAQWLNDGGSAEELEDEDDVPSEIVAGALTSNLSTGQENGQVLERIAGLLTALLAEVRQNRPDPKQAAIFFGLILPTIYFLLTPIYDVYSKRVIEMLDPPPVTQPAREANKSMSLQAREFKLTPMLLSEIRFVNCKKDLLLRATPRKNASSLPMRIPRGQPVQVIDTKDRWTKIRWTDSEQNFVIEGWIFTRYLRKFSR